MKLLFFFCWNTRSTIFNEYNFECNHSRFRCVNNWISVWLTSTVMKEFFVFYLVCINALAGIVVNQWYNILVEALITDALYAFCTIIFICIEFYFLLLLHNDIFTYKIFYILDFFLSTDLISQSWSPWWRRWVRLFLDFSFGLLWII